LKPTAGGYRDIVDLWYARRTARNPRRIRLAMRLAFKVLNRVIGQTFAPDVTMAIRRAPGGADRTSLGVVGVS
jgi:hypothetical protein